MMTLRLRLIGLALMLALAGGAALPAVNASAAAPVQIPITGIFTGSNGTIAGPGTFSGVFALEQFVVSQGQLLAQGTLTGTFTNTATGATQTLPATQIQLPVASVTGSCQILHLELGPLDLNLLGLQVHLDRVVLDITAQSGPGNLLGNLLCAVAHLLDSNASLQAIAQLLNHILGALG